MHFRSLRLAAALVTLGVTAAPAALSAQFPVSTGSNVVAGVDQAWQVSVNGGSSWFNAFVVTSPPGAWQANTAAYKWISFNAAGSGATGSPYIFRSTFDLTGYDPTTFGLDFRCAHDNFVGSYSLNGAAAVLNACGPDNNFQFGGTNVLNSGYVGGSNTIDFLVNGDNTTDGFLLSVDAVRAQRLGTSVTPEPATMALLATGLVSLTAMRRRKRA